MTGTVFDLLDFPKKFQSELLRHLILSPGFYRYAGSMLKITDFDYPPCQIIFDALRAYWRRYRDPPSLLVMDTLVADFATNGGPETTPLRPEEQPAFYEFWNGIRMAYGAPLSEAYFQQELVTFIQSVRFNGIISAATGGGLQAIRHALQEANELNKLKGQAVPGGFKFLDAWKDHKIATPESFIKIPTGIRPMDGAIGGGLGLGQMGLVMACPGVGKTNTLLNIAAHATLMGYRVLFITYELAADRIERRFQSITANIYAESLLKPPEQWSNMEMVRWSAAREIMPPHGMVVIDFSEQINNPIEAIDAVVREWKQEMTKRYGAIALPLLVCVDWLHPKYIKISHTRDAKTHEIMADLAKEVSAVGRSNKVALWSACQGNRGANGKLTLDMNDMAGAFDISQPIDLGVGLAPIKDPTRLQPVAYTRAGEDDDNAAANLVQGGRMLSFSSFKVRDYGPFMFEAFQGPTLRIFGTQGEWNTVERSMRDEQGNELDGIQTIRDSLARGKK